MVVLGPQRKCTGSAAQLAQTFLRLRSGSAPCGAIYHRFVIHGRIAACGGALILAATLSAGCGRTSGLENAPAACTGGSASGRVAALRTALARAPAPVRFEDGTSISDCLAHDSASGDIQTVGAMLLTVTQQVVDSESGRHDTHALLELGYMAGAVHRGTAGAQGVNGEIERRIAQELDAVDTAAPAFKRGEKAGRASG